MESAYKPELWHDVFVVIGTSAGTLVGLLFIVISLHIGKINERSDDDMRAIVDGARHNTVHLLIVLVEALLVLAPQPASIVGWELIALNVFGMRGPVLFSLKYAGKRIRISPRGRFPTGLILTIAAAYLAGIGGGMAVLERLDWSLSLVAASSVTKIVRAVLSAWMLMFGLIQTKISGPER